MAKLVLFVCLWALGNCIDPKQYADETYARTFMENLNIKSGKLSNRGALAEWDYASNLTDENLAKKLNVSAENAKELKKHWEEVIKFSWKNFKDENLKRQFKLFSVLGNSALPEDKHQELETAVSDMESIYSKAKICDFKDKSKCNLSLEPELNSILSKSRDPEELKHVWKEWRDESGKKTKKIFQKYVTLSNEAAILNRNIEGALLGRRSIQEVVYKNMFKKITKDMPRQVTYIIEEIFKKIVETSKVLEDIGIKDFTDSADYWLDDFEDKNFQAEIEGLWKQLQPLYLQVHAYVRAKLRQKYGEEIVSKTGPIPAHLLGNMWSQTWSNIIDFTQPYPGIKSLDVTPEMVKQGYTPLKMFKLSEEFFASLNLSRMPDSFWKKSILEKPSDREIICHASAWDFYDGKDFRIKQCTKVTGEQLRVAHHEMGHIQYYLQYKDQPQVYKAGANSGFHEAVGDTIALSVSTPSHMEKIGLLKDYKESKEATINYLFFMALDKIAFLPFGYLMDLWRWDVFRGKITPENYNCQWWKLRHDYQGVEPPVDRTEDDFDPGAKYHIIADVPYIRYFVSFVVQFQFHKALCEKAGQFDPKNPEKRPLNECDIYQSTEAGNLFGKLLQMGSSKPWPEAMEVLTGQKKMDAGPLLEYFRPLTEWLTKENQLSKEFIGWNEPKHKCVSTKTENTKS